MIIYIIALAAGILYPMNASAEQDAVEVDLTLAQLEQRLASIDDELGELARMTLRSGVGNIGWISNPQNNPNNPEWAQIDLPEKAPIDQIVLVPVLWYDAEKGPQADGFPEAFEIVAGVDGDSEGEVIASYGPEDHFLPRVAPLVIPIAPTSASWVRIKATRLAQHARGDEKSRFKLSEIMVFSGGRNIALKRPVSVSSTVGGWGAAAIFKEALVDGLTPYLMDAAGKEKSNPYLVRSSDSVPFVLTIDLEESHPIDGIRLHGADVNEYIPQINPTDFGMPLKFIVKGANHADFSDAKLLLEYQRDSIYQTGNITEWRIPESDCRYVRLIVPRGTWPRVAGQDEFCISLAEVEIIAHDRNVARGKQVQYPKKLRAGLLERSLTDGLNHFGRILPIRSWMEQLARRHDLENARPVVAGTLNRGYLRQKANLTRMSWFAALLAGATVIILLTEQVFRQRAVLKARERIAANLHDELGANLHAIGMLGDLAKAETAASERLKEIVTRIRALTERTGNAARACTDMLESKNPCDNLFEEMEHCSFRLLADIEHELSFRDEKIIHRLKPKKRADLFLFYKECLTNILRHSGATHITTRLEADGRKRLQLIITDNGQGTKHTPSSLKRRARLLRAKLDVETPPEGGTRITLKLKPHTFGFGQ